MGGADAAANSRLSLVAPMGPGRSPQPPERPHGPWAQTAREWGSLLPRLAARPARRGPRGTLARRRHRARHRGPHGAAAADPARAAAPPPGAPERTRPRLWHRHTVQHRDRRRAPGPHGPARPPPAGTAPPRAEGAPAHLLLPAQLLAQLRFAGRRLPAQIRAPASCAGLVGRRLEPHAHDEALGAGQSLAPPAAAAASPPCWRPAWLPAWGLESTPTRGRPRPAPLCPVVSPALLQGALPRCRRPPPASPGHVSSRAGLSCCVTAVCLLWPVSPALSP